MLLFYTFELMIYVLYVGVIRPNVASTGDVVFHLIPQTFIRQETTIDMVVQTM